MALASDLRDAVKTRLRILNSDSGTDAIILEYVNMAIQDVANDRFSKSPSVWSWLRRAFSFNTSSGVMLYPIGVDGPSIKHGSLRELRVDSTFLRPTDSAAVMRSNPDLSVSGDPTYWWVDGLDVDLNNAMVIGLWPVPSSTLLVSGVFLHRIAELNVDDTVPLPESAIDVVKDVACWSYSQRDDENRQRQRHFELRAMSGLTQLRMDDINEDDRVLVAGGAGRYMTDDVEAFGQVSGYGRPA